MEVVDAPLDYNLLLGCSWSYAMTAIVSSVFRLIKFPHNGKIVTIDQLTYFSSDPASLDSIQHVSNTTIPYKDVGVGLIKYFGLLGTFSFPPPNVSPSYSTINMISSNTIAFNDPSVVPSNSEVDSFGDAMPLSPFEIAYQAIQSFSDSCSTKIHPMNVVHGESLSISTSDSTNFSDLVHMDEQIREILSVDDLPWEDLHHLSSFLPELDHFENDFSSIFTTEYVKEPQNTLQHPDSELNLGNIS